MNARMTLTKEDLGPKRRLFDKFVRYGVAFMIGWGACQAVYHVNEMPGIKDSSRAWFQATSDRFDSICTAIYGPKRASALVDEARRR